MKVVFSILLAASLATLSETARSQTTAGSTAPAQGQIQIQNNNQANPPVDTFPPGLQNRPLPPGLRRPLPPGLANRSNGLSDNSNMVVIGTNSFLSNQFLADSNAVFGSNRFGYITNSYNVISNASRLLPTSNSNALTRIYGTNALNSNFRLSDQAFSDSDKSLLLTLRQSVGTQLGVAPITGTMPVHFYIRNGVVTLVGFVLTPEESQRVALLVQQTPGVVSVVNDLQVTNQSGVSPVQPMGQTLGTGGTTPITVQPNVTATNVLPPTGVTNNEEREEREGLPPGLQRREELPPGLENREALPPGLERRTNTDVP